MARAPKHKKAMRKRIAGSAGEPPSPDEADELASPACYAHEVDPAYMFAPSPPVSASLPEHAVKPAPMPKPQRMVPAAKPLPHDRGRGRLRVGRARRDRPR